MTGTNVERYQAEINSKNRRRTQKSNDSTRETEKRNDKVTQIRSITYRSCAECSSPPFPVKSFENVLYVFFVLAYCSRILRVGVYFKVL